MVNIVNSKSLAHTRLGKARRGEARRGELPAKRDALPAALNIFYQDQDLQSRIALTGYMEA